MFHPLALPCVLCAPRAGQALPAGEAVALPPYPRGLLPDLLPGLLGQGVRWVTWGVPAP
jgi:hypothetical protein